MKFDREIYNIILIHAARTWERVRVNQPFEEMPLDNIESTEAIQSIADEILDNDLVQEFIEKRDGGIWDRFGDGCSDTFIERVCEVHIHSNYLK